MSRSRDVRFPNDLALSVNRRKQGRFVKCNTVISARKIVLTDNKYIYQ
jgi:hypothetical protein